MIVISKKISKDEDYPLLAPLIREYLDWLGEDLCYQGIDDELKNLPFMYGPTGGGAAFLSVSKNEGVLGCGCLRALPSSGKDYCEMKRLFLRPEAKGIGLGRKLCDLLIKEAKRMGYKKMRLDTLERLEEAKKLYESLGFKQIEAYCENPLKGPLFYELDLTV
ncbi:MAG: GNAT family N-acetyltransferase [Spirochaetales bacterium]|nr:GNAT family N-acetyltransferase [Spirochaetales bacterium]